MATMISRFASRMVLTAAAAGLLISHPGCSRKTANNLGADCARLGGQKDPQGALACFKRILAANPNYTDAQIKALSSLTPEEVGVVNNLCSVILQEYFHGQIVWNIKTDFFSGPTSAQAPASKPLGKGFITLSGVVIYAPTSSREKIQAALQQLIDQEAIVDGGKSYRILRPLIRVNEIKVLPSSNGQTVLGAGYFEVTVIPDRVAVYSAPAH
jgi:hypothetical protein